MKDLYIIGAGGFAKEVFQLISQIDNKINIVAFIDREAGNSIHLGDLEVPIITEEYFLNNIKSAENIIMAMGIGEPKLIRKLALKFKSYTFPNFIHPRAQFDTKLNLIGLGNIITNGVVFTNSIKIGNFNIFNLSCTVGHDVMIGDYNVVNPLVAISGCVKIGDSNLMGVGSVILQYKEIGNDCIIGASSLVTKTVNDGSTIIGVPGKAV